MARLALRGGRRRRWPDAKSVLRLGYQKCRSRSASPVVRTVRVVTRPAAATGVADRDGNVEEGRKGEGEGRKGGGEGESRGDVCGWVVTRTAAATGVADRDGNVEEGRKGEGEGGRKEGGREKRRKGGGEGESRGDVCGWVVTRTAAATGVADRDGNVEEGRKGEREEGRRGGRIAGRCLWVGRIKRGG